MKTRPHARPSWIPVLVGLLCVASGSSAKAQVPSAPASCDADQECNRLANAASDASQAGHFDEAQRAYKAAYARQTDPALLFNLARVLHKAGRLAEAITYYQKYLDAGAEGSAEYRQKAQQRMAEARREQAVAMAATKPAPPTAQSVALLPQSTGDSSVPRESPQGTPVYRKWWLWTVVGVAVAGVAVGVGLGVAARRPDLTGYSDARPFGS